LTLSAAADPASVAPGGDVGLSATLQRDSHNALVSYDPPPLTPLAFTTTSGALDHDTVLLGNVQPLNHLTAPHIGGSGSVAVGLDAATIQLAFDVVAPLASSPATKDFGTIAVGAGSAPTTFTITNTSAAPVKMKNLVLQGPDAADFSAYLNGCRTTLAPSASCAISARFRPTSAGPKTAGVDVVTDGSTLSIDLSGTATGDVLALAPPSAAFGSVQTGGSSSKRTFTITNIGAVDSTIKAVQVTGADASSFPAYASACKTTLAPSASCSFSVFFRPATSGAKTATITITSTTDAPHSAPLTGRGTSI
jgi:hypothetical protein